MTKEMRPSHRTDVLVHALLYYGCTTKRKLGIQYLYSVTVTGSLLCYAHYTSITIHYNNNYVASLLLRRWKKANEMKTVAVQQFTSLVANVQGL